MHQRIGGTDISWLKCMFRSSMGIRTLMPRYSSGHSSCFRVVFHCCYDRVKVPAYNQHCSVAKPHTETTKLLRAVQKINTQNNHMNDMCLLKRTFRSGTHTDPYSLLVIVHGYWTIFQCCFLRLKVSSVARIFFLGG